MKNDDTAANPLALPLVQSPQYARACERLGVDIRAFRIRRNNAIQGWCQIQSRQFGRLGRINLISRGPVWQNNAPGPSAGWLMAWLRQHNSGPVIVNADCLPNIALRSAGFWPLMTPSVIAMLPLTSNTGDMRRALHQKWRNRLRRGENSGLRVRVSHLLDTPDTPLLKLDAEQQKARKYQGLPPQVSLAYAQANAGEAPLFTATFQGRVLASALFLRHGQMATYQIGHSTDEGRHLNAQNVVIWQAMCWLAARGHTQLDLGVINTQDAPGLARFKLGTGAAPHELGGTWLHHPALAPFAKRLPQRLAA